MSLLFSSSVNSVILRFAFAIGFKAGTGVGNSIIKLLLVCAWVSSGSSLIESWEDAIIWPLNSWHSFRADQDEKFAISAISEILLCKQIGTFSTVEFHATFGEKVPKGHGHGPRHKRKDLDFAKLVLFLPIFSEYFSGIIAVWSEL